MAMRTVSVQSEVFPRPGSRRAAAAVVLAAAIGPLLLAAWLAPSQRGHGTHEQLGLAPCGLMERTGVPCPSCGMTTAFAHAADGDIVAAVVTQPFGALLALATAAVAVSALWVLATDFPVEQYLRAVRWGRLGWLALGLLLAAWGYKIFAVWLGIG